MSLISTGQPQQLKTQSFINRLIIQSPISQHPTAETTIRSDGMLSEILIYDNRLYVRTAEPTPVYMKGEGDSEPMMCLLHLYMETTPTILNTPN